MAAERAKTIAKMTKTKSFRLNTEVGSWLAIKKPSNAKGNAKIVWLNFTRERYFVNILQV